MATAAEKGQFMEAACNLRNRENRVMASDLMGKTGWDVAKYIEIAKSLIEDSDIRANETKTLGGVPTGEVFSWDFIWITQPGLTKWCQ